MREWDTMAASSLQWKLRQRIWTSWQIFRFKAAKMRPIPPPVKLKRIIGLVPFCTKTPAIPLQDIRTFDTLPKSESDPALRAATAIDLWLTERVSPMQPGVPAIDGDITQALDVHLTGGYRKAFRSPVRPAAFTGPDPDLGELAVRGPYAYLLERDLQGDLCWDLRSLGDYKHHNGLCNLGLRVVFAERERRLEATQIDSIEFGTVRPEDQTWAKASRLAVCAATTHTSLARHFNFVHLIAANHWDVTTRNELGIDHPVFRLVWPHIANSMYTNYGITAVQMLPDGDFAHIFSFSAEPDGLYKYFDDSYESYDVRITNPELDWERRGLGDTSFDRPTHDNLMELFTVMRAHASRYLHAYYASDEALRADAAVMNWLACLGDAIPNYVQSIIGTSITRDSLAQLIAGFIHEGSVVHSLVGTSLWDYQLWADQNPTQLRRDGTRVRVDVFQRMINNNFGLQLRRAGLQADYGYLALDDGVGPPLFSQFLADLVALQSNYDANPTGSAWRMEPKTLEMSMNG